MKMNKLLMPAMIFTAISINLTSNEAKADIVDVTCMHNGQSFATITLGLPPHLSEGLTCEQIWVRDNPGHNNASTQSSTNSGSTGGTPATDPSQPAHHCVFSQHSHSEPNY